MINDTLYDWQKELVEKIKGFHSYGIWLDMGLGKTPISLALCEENKIEKVLIITINAKAEESIKDEGSWPFWASKSSQQYKISSKKEMCFSEPETCYIVNYEWLRDTKKKSGTNLRENIKSFLSTCKGKRCALVVDESHKMKDSSSVQTKCINLIWSIMKKLSTESYLYLLTGTPFTQGYIDLYTQLKILGVQMNKSDFKNRYCIMGSIPGLLEWQQPIVGYRNTEELLSVVHQHAVTVKSDQVLNLPDQVFVYHTQKMSDKFKLFVNEKIDGEALAKQGLKNYQKGKKYLNPFFRNIAYPDFTWSAETSGQFWLRARELSIGFQGNSSEYVWYDNSRLEALENFLKENQDNYILFYSFTPELIKLFEICERLGYNIDVYSGEIKTLENYQKYSSLSQDSRLFAEKKNVILTNWQSGSTGMNFQTYSKCIVFDLPVYRDWEQGLKRIHRTGQKDTCIYHIFSQDNFLDRGMLDAIRSKETYNKDLFEKQLKENQK